MSGWRGRIVVWSLALVACGGTVALEFPGVDGGVSPSSQLASPCPRADERSCDGACVAMRADALHCGACGVACSGATPLCDLGTCSPSCTPGLTQCERSCVDLASDPRHCGSCSVRCAASEQCVSGRCGCGLGTAACPDGCRDLATDPRSCGACGVVCEGATPLCDRGTCAASCGPGLVACGQSCVDTRTSATHCGACNTACKGGQTCVAGACTCANGQELCNGACVNVTSSEANCGACGERCPRGQVCSNGVLGELHHRRGAVRSGLRRSAR